MGVVSAASASAMATAVASDQLTARNAGKEAAAPSTGWDRSSSSNSEAESDARAMATAIVIGSSRILSQRRFGS